MELEYLQKLEPEIKLFCFDKFDAPYAELTPEEQAEEAIHIRNGLNYAKKVLVTHECDVLILDEILDVLAKGIVEPEDVISLLEAVDEDTAAILTGFASGEALWPYVDCVTELSNLKQKEE